jgi:hypothetical protein
MRRRSVLLAAVALATAAILSGSASAGADTPRLVRWDMVQFSKPFPPPTIVLAGGTNTATDPATGDTVTLTGSGQAEPRRHRAAGGGTLVHKDAQGAVVAEAFYVVTGFVSFRRVAGTLVGTGIIDGIGFVDETSSGVLRVRVKIVDADGTELGRGTLTVHCTLPGAPPGGLEGSQLRVRNGPQFTHIEEGSFTLFHLLR